MAAHPTCRAQKFPLFKDAQMQFCELKKKKKGEKVFTCINPEKNQSLFHHTMKTKSESSCQLIH